MKKIFTYFCFIFIVSSIYAQQINKIDEHGLKQGKWTVKYNNGKVKYTGNFIDNKPTGKFVRYFESGKKSEKINYVADTAFVVMYNTDGKRIASGKYINKLKQDKWMIYSGAKVMAIQEYVDDTLNGITTNFDVDGKKQSAYTFKNGIRDGVFAQYHKNQVPECVGYYKDNVPDGNWIFYNDKNDSLYTYIYNMGVIQNRHVSDSIEQLRLNNYDQNNGQLKNPDNYINNPEEFFKK